MELEIGDAQDGVTRVALVGRLDSAGVDRVETRFSATTAAVGRDTVVDLSRLEFIASMGIRMLIVSARALSRKGARLVLLDPPKLVEGVLRDTVVDEIIPVVHGEDAVREILAGSA